MINGNFLLFQIPFELITTTHIDEGTEPSWWTVDEVPTALDVYVMMIHFWPCCYFIPIKAFRITPLEVGSADSLCVHRLHFLPIQLLKWTEARIKCEKMIFRAIQWNYETVQQPNSWTSLSLLCVVPIPTYSVPYPHQFLLRLGWRLSIDMAIWAATYLRTASFQRATKVCLQYT